MQRAIPDRIRKYNYSHILRQNYSRVRSPGLRWFKEGNRERLRGRNRSLPSNGDIDSVKCFYEEFEDEDRYLDGKSERKLLRLSVPVGDGFPGSTIAQQIPGSHLYPSLLEYIVQPDNNRPPRTLSQYIACGGVTIKGKQLSKDGDTLWVLEIDRPASSDWEKTHPMFMRIYVDADKGYLVSRVVFSSFKSNPPVDANDEFENYPCFEVTTFKDCGRGVYFPSFVKCHHRFAIGRKEGKVADVSRLITFSVTRLSVNKPLPADAFEFRFPDKAVVRQVSADHETTKVMIWGPDNQPVKEFGNGDGFRKFRATAKTGGEANSG